MLTVKQTVWSSLVFCSTISITFGVYNYELSRFVKYEGCLKKVDMSTDFRKLALRHGLKETNFNIVICVKECWFFRNRIAALQKGTDCYCARSVINAVKVPEGECNLRCKGDCYQTCGGENVISVYQTGYVAEEPFEIDKNALLSAKIGCYDAVSSRAVLCNDHFPPLKTLRMTVAMCVVYCDSVHQAMFATLSAPDTCCCSNSVSGAKNTYLDWCNIPCSGSNSLGCVGSNFASQWATFHISRLPSFKRWPKQKFTEADWLEPIFPAGVTLLHRKLKLNSESDDASLSGLMAKKLARQPNNDGWKYDSLIGQDKREPAHEGVENSVAILDVANKKQEISQDNSNGIIIGAVVTGFVIFTAAFGFYIFSRRKAVEKNSNVNATTNRRKKAKVRKRSKMWNDVSDDDTNLV